MAFVGSSAVATSNLSVTPAYTHATAGNLLVAMLTGHSSAAGSMTCSDGAWAAVQQVQSGTVECAEVWTKTAVGSDAMPTWTGNPTSSQMACIVAEFSGTVILDQSGTSTGGTTSPNTVTAGGTDGGTGRLIICVEAIRASAAGTSTFTDNVCSLGVGAGVHVLGDTGATSQASHHHSLYVTTATTGTSADNWIGTWTQVTQHVAQVIVSFATITAAHPSSLQAGWNIPGSTSSQTYSGTLSSGSWWAELLMVYSATTAAAPAQVTGLTGTAGAAQMALNWNIPSANGSALTSYTASIYSGVNPDGSGGTLATTISAISSAINYAITAYLVTSLTNGTAYSATIAAVNAVGTGTASARLNPAVTPSGGSTVPSTPGAPAVIPGDTTATVTITPPGTGGSPITSYTFNCYQGVTLFLTQTQPTDVFTFLTLTDGVRYGFSGIASNANGDSTESAQTLSTPVAIAPPSPNIIGVPVSAQPSVQAPSLMRDLQSILRRLSDLEGSAPQSYSVADSSGQIRVVKGALDILGGSYVGQYGIVVLDASGNVTFTQSD